MPQPRQHETKIYSRGVSCDRKAGPCKVWAKMGQGSHQLPQIGASNRLPNSSGVALARHGLPDCPLAKFHAPPTPTHLQLGQLLHKLCGEQVGPRGGQLSNLNEGGTWQDQARSGGASHQSVNRVEGRVRHLWRMWEIGDFRRCSHASRNVACGINISGASYAMLQSTGTARATDTTIDPV